MPAVVSGTSHETSVKKGTSCQARHRPPCNDGFMRPVTAESCYCRLVRALEAVAGRLDHPWTVEEVAAETRFSRFHCHRVFRAMTGETIAGLIRRLRLERAAWRLRHEPVDVIEVALDAGYNSPEAFSRAFRRGCGMSPSRYRTAWPLPQFAGPAARVNYDPGEGRLEFDLPKGDIHMEVRIDTLAAIEIARIRHVGPYNEVGPSFERLFGWAASIGAEIGRVLTLSYDEPDDVRAENLRSDACLEMRTDASPPPGITLDTIEAGRYAVYTHRGPYDGIAESYQLLFSRWLPQSGEDIDNRPHMEIYLNALPDVSPADLLTDLCLPLRAAPGS